MRSMHKVWGAALALALLALPAAARADVIHYVGPHPIQPKLAKGMCYIEGPHFHVYKPHKQLLYVQVEDNWAFIGDPTEYEPAAPKFAYYGHHPIFWTGTVGPDEVHINHYCYITGPHHHWYQPPPVMKFKQKGNVYWYVGKRPKWYKERYARYKPVDEYYASASVTIVRPVVTVVPPSGYVGFYIGAGGHARVYGGAAASFDVPPPGLHVHIGVGGPGPVVVGGPGPVVVGGRYKYKGKWKHRGPPPHAPAWGYRGHKGHKYKYKGHKYKYKGGGKYKVKYKGGKGGKRKGKWK